jgi:hypothetical protein
MSGRSVVWIVRPPFAISSELRPSLSVRYCSTYAQKKPPVAASMQPFGGSWPGATATGCAEISVSSCSVMCSRSYIRCRTWLRRVIAFSGLVIGSSFAGLCTRPASMAA